MSNSASQIPSVIDGKNNGSLGGYNGLNEIMMKQVDKNRRFSTEKDFNTKNNSNSINQSVETKIFTCQGTSNGFL